MKRLIILMAFLSFACSGDDNSDDVYCTTEAVAGLTVTVKDAQTNEFITEGITVTAQAGNYTEELQNIHTNTQFIGAFERADTYIITVEGEGYETFTSEPVTVGSDICHVITEEVAVILQYAVD